VQVSVDFGHVYLNQQAGGPPPDQWVRDAGDLLAHTHIQDNDGLDDRHWPAGRGNINWFAVFSALRELEVMPRLILEAGECEWVSDYFRTEGFAC
jgi:sugar phosphate isomerase/epimerase